MEALAVSLSPELKQRLEALATRLDKGVGECLALAVLEFVDNWEIHLNDLHQIDDKEARAVLKAANE